MCRWVISPETPHETCGAERGAHPDIGCYQRVCKGTRKGCQDADIKGLKAGSRGRRGLLVGGSGSIKVQEGMWRHWMRVDRKQIPWWLRQWRVCLQWGRPRFNHWVRKSPWRRKWQPTPVFLPGESQGQRTWRVMVHRVAKSWTGLKTSSMHACRGDVKNELRLGLWHQRWKASMRGRDAGWSYQREQLKLRENGVDPKVKSLDGLITRILSEVKWSHSVVSDSLWPHGL